MQLLVDFAGLAEAPDALALAGAIGALTGAEMIFDAPPTARTDLIVSQVLPPEAPAALALAPLGLAAGAIPLERVAVGFDGSRESALALALGERLAGDLGGTLRIVAVADSAAAASGAEEERLRRHLERALDAVPPELEADSRLLYGPVEQQLLEASADAHLLVLGSRSHFGGAPRMRPGSTATALARSAPRPLVLVPA